MKKCKFCAEEIQDDAIKCKHCGEFSGEENLKKTETRGEQSGNENVPVKQKNGVWMLLVGSFLFFLNINRGGGFIGGDSPESAGYNLTSFIIWVITIVLVIKGIKRIMRKRKEEATSLSQKSQISKSDVREKLKGIKGITISTFLFLVILVIFFYLYSVKPSQIKKACSRISVTSYSQEEKDLAKKYLIEKCPAFEGVANKIIWGNKKETISQECIKNMDIQYAPLGGENKLRSASDDEYRKCLQKNGISEK